MAAKISSQLTTQLHKIIRDIQSFLSITTIILIQRQM